MGYFDDAKDLIEHCKPTYQKIEENYKNSLKEKEVKKTLLIEIKNLMENLRSALDFTAHGLFDKYGSSTSSNPRIYFPYAWSSLDKTGFQNQNIINNKIPGLPSSRPDIAAKIESYQHFENSDNEWLPKFMDLNNENKHQQLTPQTKKEIKELRITSGGAGISMTGNAGIQITGNAGIQIGNSIITGNQNINPNNPARISGNAKQEIITWVSFHFSTNGEPVLQLLKQSLEGTEKIVDELSKM